MRKVLILTLILFGSIIGVANAAPADDPTEQEYIKAYHDGIECSSQEVVGRNIQRDGYGSNYREPTHEELVESIGTLKNICAPPPAPVTSTSTAPTTSAPTTTTSTGCTGMEAESGTAGYDAYNPSSGATGCYQIIPSTAEAHNCDLSTPAGQDACAATICATEGSGAWAASGVSPC